MSQILNTVSMHRLVVFGLLVGLLVFGLTAGVTGQEEVQTGSESLGYENVGKVMSEVASADVDKSERVTEALKSLFGALADHLEEKGVPDHVVEKFENRTDSLTSMGRNGLLNKEQLSSEASNITKNALRDVDDGEVPVSVMEKAGMSEKEVEELSGKGQKGKEAAETVRKMARGREKEREEAEEMDETEDAEQEREQERAGEKEREQDEGDEAEEKESESQEGKEPGNQGNGKGNEEEKEEVKNTGSEDTEENRGNGNPQVREEEDEEKEQPDRVGNGSEEEEDEKRRGRGNGRG